MIDEETASTDEEYLDEGLMLVESMVETMARPRTATTEEETSRIKTAIEAVWKKKKTKSTITDVAIELLQKKQEDGAIDEINKELNTLLAPYCTGGRMSKYFNTPHTINIRNRYTVYEMSVLNNNKTLQALVLMMIIFMVSEKMYHGDRNIPKGIVIDEAWNLLQGDGTAKFIEGIARRARKYKTSLITGTQDLNDYSSGASNAAWNASNWRILMQQSGSSIESASSGDKKLLTLSSYIIAQAKSIRTSKGKFSEMLITESSNSKAVVGRLALDSYSVTIYSSSADDVTAIKNIQNKENVDLATAVERHAQTMRGKNMIFTKKDLLTISISTILSVTIMLSIQLATQAPQPKQIATIQLKKIIDDFVINLVKKKLNKTQNATAISTFQKALDVKLNTLAKEHNIVLMSKSAVIAGGVDLTTVFKVKGLK